MVIEIAEGIVLGVIALYALGIVLAAAIAIAEDAAAGRRRQREWLQDQKWLHDLPAVRARAIAAVAEDRAKVIREGLEKIRRAQDEAKLKREQGVQGPDINVG